MGVPQPVRVLCVVGARPNFIKIAPILRALHAHPRFAPRLLHTGQHYDDKLSRIFFEELAIPRPDITLAVGSASHAQQTAAIMQAVEPVLEAEQPQVVLVVGDVNSTLACALVASKFRLRHPFAWREARARQRPLVVHVEAGLRSFDMEMPEEVNRRLTDSLSDLLCASEPAAVDNLRREGVPPERIAFVGNVMIDTLHAARRRAAQSGVLRRLGRVPRGYGVVTLHRPRNVDDPHQFAHLLETLDEVAREVPLVFPLHPRTRARLEASAIPLDPARWQLVPPLGYLDFLQLMSEARLLLTDSGGIQEESTVLGVPCLTLRDNTERPITISEGTNILAGTQRETILPAARAALAMALAPTPRIPARWDGHAATRVVAALAGALLLGEPMRAAHTPAPPRTSMAE